MRVRSLAVKNFRLLHEVEVALDEASTVLVGRNNTGKTSLAEIVSRCLGSNDPKFLIEDFSSKSHANFMLAYDHYRKGEEEQARAVLPKIVLTVTIEYDKGITEYGPLSAIIVDLDPDCETAVAQIRYELSPGKLNELFSEVTAVDPAEATGIRHLLAVVGARIPKLYERTATAIDPADAANTRQLPIEALRNLITVDFLNAQRGLDDEKTRPNDLLAKILEDLFVAASKAADGSTKKKTADELVRAVADIENKLDESVRDMLQSLIPALHQFGYPGLGNQELSTKTRLDVEKLLSNYTSVHYEGTSGVSLPEAYSGLGSRNLVLILFTLLDYYRKHAARGDVPGVHLIFLEEPEAHLHPQMQEVFVSQLAALKELFPKQDRLLTDWSAQFLISTHASHIANQASFSAIRYFRADEPTSPSGLRSSDVLDLSTAKNKYPSLDESFLHQYLTLTRSDLFFADKAILVEGTSERLIIPKVIEKMQEDTENRGLANQYVTLLEVGGAYAHLFFPLLDFLGLPALVITDLDAIGEDGPGNRRATVVHLGDRTSNACIKDWFHAEIKPLELIHESETGSIIKASRYLAYQVPEKGEEACGRTFEDAFILANPSVFDLPVATTAEELELSAREIASGFKKSRFALRFAIRETDWNTPLYIERGLKWLLGFSVSGTETPGEAAGSKPAVAVK
jgi:predicted ATP-dependent endonuclease of OLD family